MSTKLTDTQIVMLSAAAQRDDQCLVAPRNLKGGAAQKVATKLIEVGLAKEIHAALDRAVGEARRGRANSVVGIRTTIQRWPVGTR